MAKARDDVPRPPEPPTTEQDQASAEQGEETVDFGPCAMWGHYPVQVVVVLAANMPSVTMTGWEGDCPPRWSIAGRLRGKTTWPPTPLWMETQRMIDTGLWLFIVMQWFIIGMFPLGRTQKWWAEPGAFITVCAVLAGTIAVIPAIDRLARFPAAIATLAWFWWLGLVVWKTLQLSWRMTTGWRVPRSN
ncbi:MAG TPA: hypothetical protein VG844_12340 [Terracidiphilus sp.]|nr:hypothetical protein [Terracidiphilus sp.]